MKPSTCLILPCLLSLLVLSACDDKEAITTPTTPAGDSSGTTKASDISLSGVVYNADSKPLPGVAITLGALSTVSGADGSWKLEGARSSLKVAARTAADTSLDSIPRLVYALQGQIITADSLRSLVQSGILRWVQSHDITGKANKDPRVKVDTVYAWLKGGNMKSPVRARLGYDTASGTFSGRIYTVYATDGAIYNFRTWIQVTGNGHRITGQSDTIAFTSDFGSISKDMIPAFGEGSRIPAAALVAPSFLSEFDSTTLNIKASLPVGIAHVTWKINDSTSQQTGSSLRFLPLRGRNGICNITAFVQFQDSTLDTASAAISLKLRPIINLLDSGLSFKVPPTADTSELRRTNAVRAFDDGQGTTTRLSGTADSSIRLEATWAAVPDYGARAGFTIRFDSCDFSSVAAIRFTYKSDAKSCMIFAPTSKRYINADSTSRENAVALVHELPPSVNGKTVTIDLTSNINYLKWMIDADTKNGTSYATKTWDDVNGAIDGLRFEIQPNYINSSTLALPASTWFEISDIRLLEQ